MQILKGITHFNTQSVLILKSTPYIAAVFISEINNEKMDLRNYSKAKSKWKNAKQDFTMFREEEEKMDELNIGIIDVSSLAYDHMVYFI